MSLTWAKDISLISLFSLTTPDVNTLVELANTKFPDDRVVKEANVLADEYCNYLSKLIQALKENRPIPQTLLYHHSRVELSVTSETIFCSDPNSTIIFVRIDMLPAGIHLLSSTASRTVDPQPIKVVSCSTEAEKVFVLEDAQTSDCHRIIPFVLLRTTDKYSSVVVIFEQSSTMTIGTPSVFSLLEEKIKKPRKVLRLKIK